MKSIISKKSLKISVILMMIIIALIAFSACATDNTEQDQNDATQNEQTGTQTGTQTAANPYTLYFANSTNANQLVPVQRTYTKNWGTDVISQADEMMTALIAGPTESMAAATIPTNAKVNSIDLSADGTMTVDFKEGFSENYQALKTNSNMTVYSIVNSLTNLPGVEKVVLKENGKTFKVVDEEFTDALTRNDGLIGDVPGRTDDTPGTANHTTTNK